MTVLEVLAGNLFVIWSKYVCPLSAWRLTRQPPCHLDAERSLRKLQAPSEAEPPGWDGQLSGSTWLLEVDD